MSEEKKPFTVTDRRHFTPEGEAREEEKSGAPEAPAAPRPPEYPPTEDRPIDFSSFILSLAAQASFLLSSEEEAGEAQGPPLAEAKSLISILEMLKDKSEGRRTEQETKVLDGVLYELRMAYVDRTRTK